jgi:hypothetical protein
MRANMRQFSAGNRSGKYNSGGGYKAGGFARGENRGSARSTSGS